MGTLRSSMLILALALCPGLVRSQSQPWPEPNATFEQVQKTARRGEVKRLALNLHATLRERPAALLSELEALAVRDHVSWAVREAALVEFLQMLSAADPVSVPAEAISYLSRWPSHTRIPHEEVASVGAPAFDIAALAQGLNNRWRRESALRRGVVLLNKSSQAYLNAWSMASDPATRAGLLDALPRSNQSSLRKLLAVSMEKSGSDADFTVPAARSALALRDLGAITRLISAGAGVEARALMQACHDLLDANQLFEMLTRLNRDAAPASTALAIGVWSRKLSGHAASEALLLDLLGDPALGGSAALALSLRPSAPTRARLHALAATPDTSPRAARARLALRMDQVAELPR